MISNFEAFEWHEEKRLSNFEKHKIDFEDAAKVFQNPFLRLPCRIATELQFRAVGVVSDDILITVVYTDRLGVCRIISARKARANERKAYYKAFGQ